LTHLPDYLAGAVNLHIYSAPDIDRRQFNDPELAWGAKEAGVGAVLIKSHQNFTVERAWPVAQRVPGIRVYGELVLKMAAGLALPAVRLALQLGAQQIWGCLLVRLETTVFTINSQVGLAYSMKRANYCNASTRSGR